MPFYEAAKQAAAEMKPVLTAVVKKVGYADNATPDPEKFVTEVWEEAELKFSIYNESDEYNPDQYYVECNSVRYLNNSHISSGTLAEVLAWTEEFTKRYADECCEEMVGAR